MMRPAALRRVRFMAALLLANFARDWRASLDWRP